MTDDDDGLQMTDAGLVGTIREIHHIKGRGRVLILVWGDTPVRIHPGDAVEIRLPGGRVVPTRLAGVGTLCGGDFSTVDVLLPKEMDAMEVPPGAEVWKPARGPKLFFLENHIYIFTNS